MTDLDLDPRSYRDVQPVVNTHRRWFWWSIAAAFVAFLVSAWTGPTYWTVLLVGVALFTAGKSYSRWVHEPVFQAGGMTLISAYLGFMAFAIIVSVIVHLVFTPILDPSARALTSLIVPTSAQQASAQDQPAQP